MPDHNGNLRRLSEFRGKLVVVFFGFTNCPDVCPTTLQTLAQATKALGPDGDAVQVIMISADPAFDPRFIGLIPGEEALKQVAGQFKAFVNRNKPDAKGFYSVDHTSASYVFDRSGRARLPVPHTFSDRDWAKNLQVLLRE